jgi:hypothetical protein
LYTSEKLPFGLTAFIRVAQELAEFDTPQARYQAVLDRHWESQREQDEPDDMYEVGGFIEYHSRTFSFHKSRRDRDWRIK